MGNYFIRAFKKLEEKRGEYEYKELHNKVSDLVDEILKVENSFLEVDKQWVSYGTWKSKPFVNEYYFGKELAELIEKSLKGKITHDEEKQFTIEEFRERLEDNIYEYLYH